MDNIAAPMLTAAGDILTLPALVLATLPHRHPHLLDRPGAVLSVVAGGRRRTSAFRLGAANLRRILAESLPDPRPHRDRDDPGRRRARGPQGAASRRFPALFILLPAFLQEGGALGGILSSRLSSKVHLGLIAPRGHAAARGVPGLHATYIFAAGVYVFIGGASHWLAVAAASRTGSSPGFLAMIGHQRPGGAHSDDGGRARRLLRLHRQLPPRARPRHVRHPDHHGGGGPARLHEPYNCLDRFRIGGVRTCARRDHGTSRTCSSRRRTPRS